MPAQRRARRGSGADARLGPRRDECRVDGRRGRRVRCVAGDSHADGRRRSRLSTHRGRRARGRKAQGTDRPVASRAARFEGGGIMSARAVRLGGAVLAAGLVALSAWLPLWTMTMRAPQYPKGLRLYAFGSRMAGDLRELTILNHYIGMPPIEAPALETSLFPIGIGLLVALCLAAPLHRWVRRAAVAATIAVPIGILVDLQWRLYLFGHTLNPTAPIRLKAFTPLVLGPTHMGNFVSTGRISLGFVCLASAALVLWAAGRFSTRIETRRRPDVRHLAAAVAATIALVVAGSAAQASTKASVLQARLDAAPRGGTVLVEPGIYTGPIVIHGPLSVVAKPGAILDGGGRGSVVTIDGDDVVLRGFAVRNSG